MASASGVSAELTGLVERLLDVPQTWIPRDTTVEGWLELLTCCGVRDGLPPVPLGADVAVPVRGGWWWEDPARIADYYRMNETDRNEWVRAIDLGGWPNHPGAEYVSDGRPYRIPGQSDFERLSDKARMAFSRPVLRGLAGWPEHALSFQVYRRINQGDPFRFPSPAKAFLSTAAWLRVSKPGSGGEDEWVPPKGAWLITASEREPYFAPVLAGQLRSEVEGSAQAQRRLVSLGAHFWGDSAHAAARMALLGQLLHDGRVASGLVAQVRNAVEETWRTLVGEGAPMGFPKPDMFLVVARRDQLDTVAVSGTERFYVLGSPDRTLELVLASLGEPVLAVSGDIGEAALALVDRGGSSAGRLIRPSDLHVEVDGKPVDDLLPGAGLLLSSDRLWLADLVALTLELKPTAFRPPSEIIVQNALQRLGQIRLIGGEDVALRLDGERRDVPAYSRQVVPTAVDGVPVIAWVLDGDGMGWRDLRRLAPAIAELVRERGARDALLNVVQALGEGGGMLEEPTDGEYAEAFGVPDWRVRELRRSHRNVVSQVLLRLVPVVAALVGLEDALKLRDQVVASSDAEDGIVAALAVLRGRVPGNSSVETLLAAARGSRSIGEACELTGVGFAEMNRALARLGPPYVPEEHADLHAAAMSAYLAAHRDSCVDAIRVQAMAAGQDHADGLTRYGMLAASIDAAAKRDRLPDSADLLAADPEWLLEYREPPESVLEGRVSAWLVAQGVDPTGESGLESASALRAANGRKLFELLPRVALVIGAWVDRHGISFVPRWASEIGGLVRDLAVSGQLDFSHIGDEEIVELLVDRHGWPAEMDRSFDLRRLGLTEGDVVAQRSEDERRSRLAERAKRGVEVAGRLVTLDADTIGEAVDHILATIDPASLMVSFHEAGLKSVHTEGKRRGGGSGVAGAKGGSQPKERLEAIGFVGELVHRSTNSLTIRRGARMMAAWPIVLLPPSFSTTTAGRR